MMRKRIFFLSLIFCGTFWLSGFVLQDECRHKKREALPLMQRRDLAHNPDEFLEDVSICDLHLDSLKKTFCWKVRGDSAGRRYYVEEKRWNRFYKLNEMSAQAAGSNAYAVHVPVDSVLYYVCVKYYSKGVWRGRGLELEVKDDVYCPTIDSWSRIYFSKKTRFQIYDVRGKLIKEGYDSEAFHGDLPDGVYYLNYGNHTTEFIRHSNRKKNK
jgi:hypothetical protein